MAAIIFQQTPGALIPQADRSVTTFQSGLVRVDQSFICPTANEATHRATLAVGNDMPTADDTPAVDGLKIFPAVQEIRRGDGFTEFRVSAYGRTSTTPKAINLKSSLTGVAPIAGYGINGYHVWVGSGTIAAKKTPEIIDPIRDALNEIADILPPFNILFTDKRWKVLSITEHDRTFTGTGLLLPEIVIKGRDDESVDLSGGVYSSLAFNARQYKITYSSDGITEDGNAFAWIEDPIIQIENIQDFGDFIEADFTIKRNGDYVSSPPGDYP